MVSDFMKQSGELKKKLEEIIGTKDFERLSPYRNSEGWTTLSEDEKELLAQLFVMQGEKQLAEGDSQVLESFRLANQIAPNQSKILYRQAVAFGQQHHNQFCLKAACRIFETLVGLKPEFFDAWHGWANTLVLLGSINQEQNVLAEAITTFSYAEKLVDKVPSTKLGAFYKDQGLCWFSIGKLSEEPNDFKNAITSFRKASKFGLNDCHLWNAYGNALFEIAELINKTEMVVEAVELYWKAIKLKPDFLDGWYNLAASLQFLYHVHPQETYFTLANESYEQVTKLESDNPAIWSKWGQLLFFRAKYVHDIELLKEANKKYEAADKCEPNHPLILSAWAEAIMTLGKWTDNLDLLREARDKIILSLELQKETPRIWCLLGNCLSEMGRYFEEKQYYQDAIEKYRFGLSLDPKDYMLWYGLAHAYTALGYLTEDFEMINESSQCWTKVMECGGQNVAEAWNDWGLSFMKLAHLTDDKKYIQSALHKFEQALRLHKNTAPREFSDADVLFNYGCALEYLGDHEENLKSYEKALESFKKIPKINRDLFQVNFHIAYVYSRLGEITNELDHFIEANQYFEKYLQKNPEDDHAWGEWGLALLNMAELVREPARPDLSQKLYSQSESRLIHAASLGNGAVLYTLACLYSLNGNYSSSLSFLGKSKEHGVLPSMEDLVMDHWLDNIRQTPGFRMFLSDLE